MRDVMTVSTTVQLSELLWWTIQSRMAAILYSYPKELTARWGGEYSTSQLHGYIRYMYFTTDTLLVSARSNHWHKLVVDDEGRSLKALKVSLLELPQMLQFQATIENCDYIQIGKEYDSSIGDDRMKRRDAEETFKIVFSRF